MESIGSIILPEIDQQQQQQQMYIILYHCYLYRFHSFYCDIIEVN